MIFIWTIRRYHILWRSFSTQPTFEIKISKIENCGLQRIGELPNEFDFGACGTFIFAAEERVMFCFPSSGRNQCFRWAKFRYDIGGPTLVFNLFSVTISKLMWIIPIQFTTIILLLLVISIIMYLQLGAKASHGKHGTPNQSIAVAFLSFFLG